MFLALMGKMFSKLRQKTALRTDERMRTMNEIIAGMRAIKMYAWEKPFAKLIDICRRYCRLTHFYSKFQKNMY